MEENTALPGWALVWEGEEPTAESALEMLHGNGLDVKRQSTLPVRLYVPDADAPTARELLRDWGM